MVTLGWRLGSQVLPVRLARLPVAELADAKGSPAGGPAPSSHGSTEAVARIPVARSPRWPRAMPGLIIRESAGLFTYFFRAMDKEKRRGPKTAPNETQRSREKRSTNPVETRTFFRSVKPENRVVIQSNCATRNAGGPCPASIPPPSIMSNPLVLPPPPDARAPPNKA